MRLALRFILPLAIALAAIAYAVVPLVDRLTIQWFVRDLDIRSSLIASAVKEQVQGLVRRGPNSKVLRFFNSITRDERLFAVAFCDADQGKLLSTQNFPAELGCGDLDALMTGESHVFESSRGPVHVSVQPIDEDGTLLGRLVLVHDMSFIERRTEQTGRYLFYFFIALGAIISLITVVIAQLSWRGWVSGMKALLRGEGLLRPAARIRAPELRTIERDLRILMRDLQNEYRQRDESQITWSPAALKHILQNDLRSADVIVVSNREPYIHTRTEQGIELHRPASGLVTALEPVMRACSGIWVAHGGGSADREMVDSNDRVAVPAEAPAYQLRRVWLTKEEEAGYYYGFANEGLWPLCHIAHVRPIFRSEDWNRYVEVNRKFANVIREEAKTDSPIVLVQDYHFAMLPRMLRDMLPNATIITFWHIPWPNPEVFAICPWRSELVDGLLGSSILGFHTQFHCNNFLDTVDRQLEALVDRELFNVSYRGQLTEVKRYPISVEWPPSPEYMRRSIEDCRAAVRRRHGLSDDHLIGIGVDRLDYTKGILERFAAVRRLLETEPQWIGRYSFIQIAAPTRSSIDEYHAFDVRVRELVDRINAQFGREGYLPIILKVEHHEPADVFEYYRAADLCYVSSLHDGMNLVAKEFVASRDDERGVLMLSQFAGASKELPEALIVNPYDIDQCAAAMHAALTMPPQEQRDRIRLMRGLIQEFNVYRWAGRMLLDAASMRIREQLSGNGVAQGRPQARG